jgi:hypothetical protein
LDQVLRLSLDQLARLLPRLSPDRQAQAITLLPLEYQNRLFR